MAKNIESKRNIYLRDVARGLFVGLFFGVIARLWMRWISTDPEFSWSGTLAIIIGFGIFGAAQRFVRAYIGRGHRKWSGTLVRAFGVIFSLQLFMAAGSSMFPAVLTGALSLWRERWAFWLRAVLAALCIAWTGFLVQVVIVSEFGIDLVTLARIFLMLIIYVWVITSLKSTVRGFQ